MIYYLLFTHWIADFVFQTDWMAVNKSASWKALAAHVGIYTTVLFLLTLMVFSPVVALIIAAINGILHFFIDAVTSRINKKLWQAERRHDFFVMIGLDQLVHTALLIASANLYL